MLPYPCSAASIRLQLLWVLLLATPLSAALGGEAVPGTSCDSIFETVRRLTVNRTSETLPDLRRDYDFLNERRYAAQFGSLASEYDAAFQTRVYYTATAKADRRGRIPRVDPEAKALYVFFHGSGTAKAGGGNFANKMTDLAHQGYAGLGFDLPFHSAGPYSEKFDDPAVLTKWIDDLIRAHRQPGQPVYLVGHSFGPDVIAEYFHRYPHSVDGGLLISPAGFRPELEEWITRHTYKMDFGTETAANTPGGEYAARFSARAGWSKVVAGSTDDPTARNPKLKIRVLIGDRDEYFPAPLSSGAKKKPIGRITYDACGEYRKIFGGADCHLEPGVGHYIFLHQDADGVNVVSRELMRLDGRTVAEADAERLRLAKAGVSPSHALARRYRQERFFRQWLESQLPGPKLTRTLARQDDATAANLIRQYDALYAKRWERLFQNIRETERWAPDFFARNRELIEKLGQPKFDPNTLLSRYGELLESLPPERRPVVAEL